MQDDLVYLVGTEVVFWPDRMKQLCKMTQLLYVLRVSSSSLVMHLSRAGQPCFCLCQFAGGTKITIWIPVFLVGAAHVKLARVVASLDDSPLIRSKTTPVCLSIPKIRPPIEIPSYDS